MPIKELPQLLTSRKYVMLSEYPEGYEPGEYEKFPIDSTLPLQAQFHIRAFDLSADRMTREQAVDLLKNMYRSYCRMDTEYRKLYVVHYFPDIAHEQYKTTS